MQKGEQQHAPNYRYHRSWIARKKTQTKKDFVEPEESAGSEAQLQCRCTGNGIKVIYAFLPHENYNNSTTTNDNICLWLKKCVKLVWFYAINRQSERKQSRNWLKSNVVRIVRAWDKPGHSQQQQQQQKNIYDNPTTTTHKFICFH